MISRVAIIGVGTSYRKVIPQEDDILTICNMVNLSLTFDHRVLDGMYGCAFLNALKRHLEMDEELLNPVWKD